MNEDQEALLQLYKELARIFEEHGIRYYGMYGTELGTIRHDGFIPWDLDIDLIVFCDDMPYISELLNTELDHEKYYFHESRADCHPHVIIKTENFEDELKDSSPLFIDLFLFYPYPDGWFRRKFFNMMATMCYISTYVLESFRSLFWYRVFCNVPGIFEKIASMVVKSDHRDVAHFVPNFRNEIYQIEDFNEPWMHKFEDTVMPIPKKWEKYLLMYFGEDYMQLPPVEERYGTRGYPVDAYLDYLMDKEIERKDAVVLRDAGVKVSVSIPLRNSEDRVYECIRHIRQQSYVGIEAIIIVDPESEDDTLSKVREYSKSLKYCKIIEGSYDDANNIGLENASGDYIWFMDVDDVPGPYFVSEMLRIIMEKGCDVIVCNNYCSYRGMVITPPDREYRITEMTGEDAVRQVCSGKIAVSSQNKLFRRSFLIENGLRFKSSQNGYDHTIRSFLTADKVIYYNKPLYTHVLKDDGAAEDATVAVCVQDTMAIADHLRDRKELHERFCAYAFKHLLHGMTGMTSDAFRKLSASDDVRHLSGFKRNGCGPDVLLYRISPMLYYRLGKLARKMRKPNNDYLFDRKI